MAPKTIFLSAALFSVAEKQFNAQLRDALFQAGFEVILPQEFSDSEGLEGLFQQCVQGVERADLVLAVVDGADVDSGVSFEIGYARAMGKPIIALRTDFRESCDAGGLNLMLQYAATEVVKASDDPFEAAADAVRGFLEG